ncbi:Centromere protein P [Collichthys lucidus]|uniref:Centromere protein P n=1 Tax=Collichthys lucidus TaxID=240159 RepID=A0A4U5UAS2_COLLU|nr:Centromere protein P [Collichthys lucidus]
MEENVEEVRLLEAQIEHLQAEVAALQSQQQENQKNMTFQLRGKMQDAMSYIQGRRQGGGKEKMLSILKEEVEKMERDLKRQTQMNGISLTSCTTKTLQSSGSKLVRQLFVSGHCSDLVFQVEFQLSEVKVLVLGAASRERHRAVFNASPAEASSLDFSSSSELKQLSDMQPAESKEKSTSGL